MALGDRRREQTELLRRPKNNQYSSDVSLGTMREVLNIKWSICYVSACEKKYHWYGLKFFLNLRCRKLQNKQEWSLLLQKKSKKYYTKCNPWTSVCSHEWGNTHLRDNSYKQVVRIRLYQRIFFLIWLFPDWFSKMLCKHTLPPTVY